MKQMELSDDGRKVKKPAMTCHTLVLRAFSIDGEGIFQSKKKNIEKS